MNDVSMHWLRTACWLVCCVGGCVCQDGLPDIVLCDDVSVAWYRNMLGSTLSSFDTAFAVWFASVPVVVYASSSSVSMGASWIMTMSGSNTIGVGTASGLLVFVASNSSGVQWSAPLTISNHSNAVVALRSGDVDGDRNGE